jgi:hypothetical protein
MRAGLALWPRSYLDAHEADASGRRQILNELTRPSDAKGRAAAGFPSAVLPLDPAACCTYLFGEKAIRCTH